LEMEEARGASRRSAARRALVFPLHGEPETAGLVRDLDATVQTVLERVDERSTALAIALAHAPDVAHEVAAFDEVARDELRQDGGSAPVQRGRAGERVDERRGDYDVADAQRRKQRLVEAAGVENAAVRIHGRQGGHR